MSLTLLARTLPMAVIAALLAVGSGAPPAVSVGPYCSLPGLDTFEWNGGGDGVSWVDAANWVGDEAPDDLDGDHGYVCLDAGATVVMGDGVSANLQAIDVAAATTLRIEGPGAALIVRGDPEDRPSVVRAGARLDMVGSNTFGGSGLLVVDGTMAVTSEGGFVNSLTTRRCSTTQAGCGARPTTPGRLVIANGGRLLIDGGGPGPNDLGGVNLLDDYQIDVRGLMQLSDRGFVSADHGTRTRLLPQADSTGVGRLLIANDGGYYEGRDPFGLPALGGFVNNGLIRKTAGAGAGVVSADYSGTGRVEVRRGSLALPDDAQQPVAVSRGKATGIGECLADSSYACEPVTTGSGDPQASEVTLSSGDTAGATVQLEEIGAPSTGNDIGVPVRVMTTGLEATPAAPATLELRYDASILGSNQDETDVQVFRRPDGTDMTYARVLPCRADGTPRSGEVACVDRRGLPGSSRFLTGGASEGDVLMVVRTTAMSRWVGR